MLIKTKRKLRHPDAPQRHNSHNRPMTRRELIGQGFLTGGATVLSGGVMGLFANPRNAMADLAADLVGLRTGCEITDGAGKIPFIAFDLAGGANIAGSNVLVGRDGPLGQFETLSTAGYSRLGLPGDMIPGIAEATPTATGNGDHTDTSLGLGFHSDSAFLRGMQASFRTINTLNVNGAIIPARSENDTGNNPHNPMYAIARSGGTWSGADGSILTLAGSRNSESGGNSMAPMSLIDPSKRPTKVDRPSDVTGLVDTGQLVGLLGPDDATAVLESIYRVSAQKMDDIDVRTGLPTSPVNADAVLKDLVKCGYLKAADVADRFGDVNLDPGADARIFETGSVASIFNDQDWTGGGADQREFQKTAAVMKLVIDGYAGAGCVTMGGYDYHGGMRQEGEVKDFRAGRCMGACLEYAAQVGVPLMLYVFSDGALSSNGVIDNSQNGRGKGEWTSDNQSTAASFFLVYNPGGPPQLFTSGSDTLTAAQHQQIGSFSADGNVNRAGTPAANNVNLLVEMVALNYMALHGAQDQFANVFPNHGLGSNLNLDSFTAFEQIQSGPVIRT